MTFLVSPYFTLLHSTHREPHNHNPLTQSQTLPTRSHTDTQSQHTLTHPQNHAPLKYTHTRTQHRVTLAPSGCPDRTPASCLKAARSGAVAPRLVGWGRSFLSSGPILA